VKGCENVNERCCAYPLNHSAAISVPY